MTKTIEENKIVERFQHSAPVDVTGLAEALGITVWEDEELPPNVSGKICQDENSGPSGYSIVVRASDPLCAQKVHGRTRNCSFPIAPRPYWKFSYG